MSHYVPFYDPPVAGTAIYREVETGATAVAVHIPPPFRGDLAQNFACDIGQNDDGENCLLVEPLDAEGRNRFGVTLLRPDQAPLLLTHRRLLIIDIDGNYSYYDNQDFQAILDTWKVVLGGGPKNTS
jgi:hypothetical protein